MRKYTGLLKKFNLSKKTILHSTDDSVCRFLSVLPNTGKFDFSSYIMQKKYPFFFKKFVN